jgi:tetratricopeptide (TPR) repeat protein
MQSTRLLAVFVLVVAGSAIARADQKQEARMHFEEGQKHFAFGEFGQAAEEYELAYKAKPDPALLYNAAQSFRLANQPERAITLYRNYVHFYPDSPNVEEVKAQIAKLKEALAAVEKAKNSPPTGTAAPVAATPTAPEVAAPEVVAPTVVANTASPPPPSDLERHTRTLRIAGFVGVAVGVAAIGVGTAFAVIARRTSDQITNAPQDQTFDPNQYAQGRVDQSAAIGLLVGGAVLAVGGATAAIVGWRAERAHRLSVAPVLSPSQVGASAGLTF